MRKVLTSAIFLLATAVFCTVVLGYTKPDIPELDIPQDINEELKKAIGALYSSDEEEQIEAVKRLGNMGADAAKAAPFLIGMIGDEVKISNEITMALVKIGVPAVKPLVNTLDNENDNVRYYASETLGRIGGKQVVDPLIKALNDTSWRVRMNAAKALGEIGDTKAVESLVAALEDENANVQYNAVIALGEIADARATESLVSTLKSSSKELRRYSTVALAQIGDERAVIPLTEALNDPSTTVKIDAIKALGKIGHSYPMEPLIELLDDRNRDIQYAAAETLMIIRKVSPRLKRLIRMLYSKDMNEQIQGAQELKDMKKEALSAMPFLVGALDVSPYVAQDIIAVLLNINGKSVKPLIAKLKSEKNRTRANAAWALGEIGDARAIEPLLALLDDRDEKVQSAALEALVKMGETARKALIKSLKDSRAEVRIFAAKALGKIHDFETRGPLITALDDVNADVRLHAVKALGEIGGKGSMQPLISMMNDTSWQVRVSAIEALDKIGDVSAGKHFIVALKDISGEVKISAAKALGKTKYSTATIYLLMALDDTNARFRSQAMKSLMRITGKDFRGSITKWKDWQREYVFDIVAKKGVQAEIQILAAKELSKLRDPSYIIPLITMVRRSEYISQNAEAKDYLLTTLKKITGENFSNSTDWNDWWTRGLAERLLEQDRDLRRDTAKKAARLNNIYAVENLIGMLKDNYPDVRRAAVEALEEITGERLGEEAVAWEQWWKKEKNNFFASRQ